MRLQTRDKELLRVIYDHQVGAIGTLSTYFFQGRLGNTSRRLSILARAGYLERSQPLGPQGRRLVRLKPLGINEIRQGYLVPPPKRGFSWSQGLEHDCRVLEVRLRLAELFPGSAWLPERAARGQGFYQIPDGVLFWGDERWAIEVELHAKSRRRYQAQWRLWKRNAVTRVLYVASSQALATYLIRVAAELQLDVPLAFTSLESLMSDTPQMSVSGKIQPLTGGHRHGR